MKLPPTARIGIAFFNLLLYCQQFNSPTIGSSQSQGHPRVFFFVFVLSPRARLFSASQDLRPPGPVPPDVAPFRLAGRADSRPSLCSFSATDDSASNGVSSRGRAFAYPVVDSTPCASHVTNWIEDNPRLAWGVSHGRRRHRQHQFNTSATIAAVGTSEGKVNHRTTGDAAKTAGGNTGAGRPTEGGERGRGDVENLQDTVAAAAAASTTKELSDEGMSFALPDVVGAGGFAEFLPLLDATIGRRDYCKLPCCMEVAFPAANIPEK